MSSKNKKKLITRKPNKNTKRPPIDQESIAFEYYEMLRDILRDMLHIDELIPRETSRLARAEMEREASAIIVHRKNELLSFIQIICRDHMYWGAKLLQGGWKPEHRRNKVRISDGSQRDWIRNNTIG